MLKSVEVNFMQPGLHEIDIGCVKLDDAEKPGPWIKNESKQVKPKYVLIKPSLTTDLLNFTP